MNKSILQIEDIVVEFLDQRILDGLSLSIQAGETVGLIGPNGSGKTTLFNAISGFVNPISGSVNFAGTNLLKLHASQRAGIGLARVFQNSGVFKELTVEENMIVALEAKSSRFDPVFTWSNSYKKFQANARNILQEVGLEEKMSAKAASLSGGQLRLLEISRAIAMDAKLILLDEPTAGVSPKMKLQVVELILKLKRAGKTLLIIEHDIELIQSICDRIVVLDSGKLALEGPPASIRSDPKLQEIYFGTAGLAP